MTFMQEAVRQWAWVYGSEHQDQCWILSDYDTWERNPHFAGLTALHPEDYDYDETPESDGQNPAYALMDDVEMSFNASDFMDDDVPF